MPICRVSPTLRRTSYRAILDEGREVLRAGADAAQPSGRSGRAARATPTAASPPRTASRTPTSRSSTAAGSASRRRPSSAAGPADDADRSWSTSSCARPTWPSPCTPGLTQGAIAALLAHGSPEQKAQYLPKMIAGEWTGTMNLTEPHCGTDLGLLRTKAAKQSRRQLQDHRHQDLHLRRRARPRRQHRPSRARAHRRRAGGHQGHLAVRRAEDPAQRRRLARRAQRACPAARSKRRWASTATPPA